MRRYLKLVLVGLLVSTLVVDVASAGWLFRRLCRACKCPRPCRVACEPLDPCETEQVAASCCPADSESVVISESIAAPIVVEESRPEPAACATCGEALESDEAQVESEAPTPFETHPESIVAEEHPGPATQPMDSATELEASPSAAAPPLLAEPAASQPSLMPSPIMPAPAETPVGDPAPATVDLGGRYADEQQPLDPPAESDPLTAPPVTNTANTKDSMSDLFDDPIPADESEAAETAEEKPMPEVMPAPVDEAEGPADLSDLFGPLPAETPDEIESEAIEPQPEEAEPETPSAPAEEAPATESPDEEEDIKTDLDDLFSQDATWQQLTVAGGLHGHLLRTWTDNTGKFSCDAKLVRVSPREVVLLRADQSELKVPLQKLSEADLHFVRDQVVALRSVRARSSTEKLAVAWAD